MEGMGFSGRTKQMWDRSRNETLTMPISIFDISHVFLPTSTVIFEVKQREGEGDEEGTNDIAEEGSDQGPGRG
jgi:hypothetical protein